MTWGRLAATGDEKKGALVQREKMRICGSIFGEVLNM